MEHLVFPGGSDYKESACNVGDPSSISGSGRCPGKGNGNPLQNSCLEISMDRGAWRAIVLRSRRVRHDWQYRVLTKGKNNKEVGRLAIEPR